MLASSMRGRLQLCSASPSSNDEASGQDALDLQAAVPDLKAPRSSSASSNTSSSTTSEPKMPFQLITLLAGLGVLDTAYLTLAKLTNNPVACPATGPVSGCNAVLNSEWATFFGVPLSLLGLAAYGALATAAAVGGSRQAAGLDEREGSVTRGLRSAMLAGGVTLATCSTALMYILFTRFPGELCPWCIGSAALSVGVLAAALKGHSPRELGRAATPAGSLVATLGVVLALNFSAITRESQAGIKIPFQEPVVATESPAGAVDLAKRLKAAGARMYGAFWCSHCFDQKEYFGRQAMADFPYVECYPEGYRQGVTLAAACSTAQIKGFPTWVIGEAVLEGEQPFEVLEQALAKLQQQVQQQAAPALVDN